MDSRAAPSSTLYPPSSLRLLRAPSRPSRIIASSGSSAVTLGRVEDVLADDLPVPARRLVLAVEAAVVAVVAGGAGLLDLDKQDVLVAVRRDRLHLLHVPAALALEPQLVAAAAEEVGL